jgi:hypothetical protein
VNYLLVCPLIVVNSVVLCILYFRSIHMAASQADLSVSVTALELAVSKLAPAQPVDLSAEVARIDAVTAAIVAFEGPVAAPVA